MLSYRFQKPMRGILNRLSTLPAFASTGFVGNEYDAIHTAFESQHNTITTLKNQMFTKQLCSLLAGDTLEIHQLPSQYFNSSFAIVFLKLQQGNMAELRNKISSPSSAGSCRVELISFNEHEMTMMYVLHEKVSHPYEAICIDVRSKCSLDPLSCQYSLAVGSIVHQLEHIQLSYQQARDAESYSYLFGTNKIVLYSDIAHRNQMIDPEWVEQWKRVLRTYDGKQIELFINQFTEHALGEPYRLDSINMSVLQFCICLSQMIMGTNIQHILPRHDWLQTIHKPAFLETIEELKAISLQAAKELNASTAHAYSFQIMKLKEYIDTHLHEDFSLNKLADMVNLSPSYVSTLFKDIVNIPFSEYLTQTRLDQAASLLVTTNESVSSIADQVGYRNVQYFCTKFRQKFGVSPVQFRKSDAHLNIMLDANKQNPAGGEDKPLDSHIIVPYPHTEVPKT
jgi:YesN/AraC family two-component response regulator